MNRFVRFATIKDMYYYLNFVSKYNYVSKLPAAMYMVPYVAVLRIALFLQRQEHPTPWKREDDLVGNPYQQVVQAAINNNPDKSIIIGGFTSRRTNVPGQVRSSHNSAINAI